MSFILLSHWNGRFGNRMHQYAYGVTYSKLNNVPFYLPSDWEGTHLVKNQYHTVVEDDTLRLEINQTHPSMNSINFRTQSIKKLYPEAKQIHPEMMDQNYTKYDYPVFFDSVCAYSQTIFDKMDKKHLLEIFEFSDKVKNTEAYKYWSKFQGKYDIVHLRRDDISSIEYNKNNPQGYSVVSKESYYKAFEKFGYNPDNIMWVSDDYTNKWHSNRTATPNLGWTYPIGSNYNDEYVFDWLEDFLKLYFARTIFRANSSFSWWASFLSPTAKVYSPVLDKQIIYGRDNEGVEIDVEFVEGNHPHWMYNNNDIIIK
jgi:hypothetical protein